MFAGPKLKVIRHYALFGASTLERKNRLVIARRYLTSFQVSFGFSADEATNAERVTIVGDGEAVSKQDERKMKRAGCLVERLLGDPFALEIILADRLRRQAEFG